MKKSLPLLAKILLIALAYASIGRISIMLAIPPGYATLIWPPSGIALVGVLIWGYRVWPGILLGSFIVNYSTSFDVTDYNSALGTAYLPLIIGSGAALQAVIGRFLLTRFADFPNKLINERENLLFLFWGGIVSCSVNATLATSVLLANGTILPSDFLVNLATWWAGDVIGVSVFAPLLLVWTMRSNRSWAKRALTVTISIFLVFAVTASLVLLSTNWERQRLALEFDRKSAPVTPALRKTFHEYTALLTYLEGFYAATDEINREDFAAFTNRLFSGMNGLQALSWNVVIAHQNRPAFEFETQKSGFENFHITQRNPEGGFRKAEARSEYVAVKYIEPFEANKNAFGFDVASEPSRRLALEQARDTGKLVATKRITLVQETGNQFGVLAFQPVYRRGANPKTITERRATLVGYMVGVFRGGDIIKAALEDIDTSNFTFRLTDESAPEAEKFLYENQSEETGISTLNETGLFGGSQSLSHSFPIDFGSRSWRVDIAPTQEYVAANRVKSAWILMISGLLFTNFVGFMVIVASGRNDYLKSLVDKQTKGLMRGEQRLATAQRIAHIGNWEKDLFSGEVWWSKEIYSILAFNGKKPTPDMDMLFNIVHPEDRENVQMRMNAILINGEAFSIDHRIQLRNDAVKVIRQHVELILEGDRPIRLSGTFQDITERSRLDEMKSEFISTVSHELRTPLTSIKGSLGLLVGGALGTFPDKASEMLRVAYANSERLITLVNDILDLNKITSGKMVFKCQPTKLAELIEKSVELNSGIAGQYDVTYEIEPLPQDVLIEVDDQRIIQVMSNLLSNATKFSPAGGTVKIRATVNKNIVKIDVEDHGSGVPVEFYEKIFGRFEQADASSTRQKGGTGLGLNISKEIIEAHGGKIGFTSIAGQGAIFFFELPISTPQDEGQHPAELPQKP